jgi:hypothetical protein
MDLITTSLRSSCLEDAAGGVCWDLLWLRSSDVLFDAHAGRGLRGRLFCAYESRMNVNGDEIPKRVRHGHRLC